MSLDMLGAEGVGIAGPYGDLYGGILSAAGTLAQAGVSAYDQDQAQKRSAAEDRSRAQAAIAADAAFARASGGAMTSAEMVAKAPAKGKEAARAKAEADQLAADVAASAQAAAGAGLSPAATAERVKAAQAGLQEAIGRQQRASQGVYERMMVRAWQAVLGKAQNAEFTARAPEGGATAPAPAPTGGFLSRKILGPVKVWHAGAGAGAVGLAWVAVRKGLFRRLIGG